MHKPQESQLQRNELQFHELDSLEVREYSYKGLGDRHAIREMHLLFHLRGTGADTRLVMRVRSRDTAERIIESIVEKTHRLWPKEMVKPDDEVLD